MEQQAIAASGIKGRIEKWIEQNSFLTKSYGNWYVGVTNSPDVRRRAHNYINNKNWGGSQTFAWVHFNAGSMTVACEIEKYFHDKGLLDKDTKGGVRKTTTYVYVYKKYRNLLDLLE